MKYQTKSQFDQEDRTRFSTIAGPVFLLLCFKNVPPLVKAILF